MEETRKRVLHVCVVCFLGFFFKPACVPFHPALLSLSLCRLTQTYIFSRLPHNSIATRKNFSSRLFDPGVTEKEPKERKGESV